MTVHTITAKVVVSTKTKKRKNKTENKTKKIGNWQKSTFVSNTNLHYCLTSEQILVHQASWYMPNRAIMLLIHLLTGTIHGDFVKSFIWEQTLPWLNHRMKTDLYMTCWGILSAPAMGGLGCIGKLITNFIGLMATLRREIIRSGTMANQMTVKALRIVGISYAAIMVHGMTYLAQRQNPLLSASGQFRQGKLETYIPVDYFSGKWYG